MKRAVKLVNEQATFVWIAFAIPAVSIFGHYLAPNNDVFKGHDWGVLSGLAMTVVAALLWFAYRGRGRWTGLSNAFLALVLVTWVYQVFSTQTDGSVFNVTAFVVPVIVLMLALKVSTKRDLNIGLLTMACSLGLIALISLLLGSLGITPSGFAVSDGGGSRLWILEQLGYPGRWGGPFGSVNYAAPVGGLLVVIGLIHRGIWRTSLVAMGGLILVMSQGRSALFSVIAAVLVLVLWSERVRLMTHRVFIRFGVLAVTTLVTAGYLIDVDPTLNGRTPIWLNFTNLFLDAPLSGVGSTGVIDFIVANEGQPGFVPHTHAHSVLLDGATRYGLTFVLLTLTLYAIAVISAMKALPQNGPGPLALTVFVIVIGSTETTYSWIYWSTYLAVLTYVVLISAAAKQEVHTSEAVFRSEAET